MAIQVDDIIRAAMRWKDRSGSDVVNVHFFKVSARGDMTDAELLQGIVNNFTAILYDDGMTAYFDNQSSFADVKFDLVEFQFGKIVTVESLGTYGPTGSLPGGSSSEPLPPGAALVLLFRTVGVKCLGRKFIGLLTEASGAYGAFVAGLVTAALTYGAEFLSAWTITGSAVNAILTPVIHSKRSNAWLGLVSTLVSTYAGYQRRRRQRVGS